MEVQQTYPSTKQGAVLIGGKHVDVAMTTYEDRLLLIITQYQKMGTLIHVTKDNLPMEKRDDSFSCHVLLGKDEPVTHVFGRNIAQVVLKGQTKPLLLSLALDDYSPAMLKAIQSTLRDYLIDG